MKIKIEEVETTMKKYLIILAAGRKCLRALILIPAFVTICSNARLPYCNADV